MEDTEITAALSASASSHDGRSATNGLWANWVEFSARACCVSGDPSMRCNCLRKSWSTLRDIFTRGDGSRDERTSVTHNTVDLPRITADSFDRLETLEDDAADLHQKHKLLREEAEGIFGFSYSRYGIFTGVGLPSSAGVGFITCGVAFELAVSVGIFLAVVMAIILAQGWNRLSGCSAKLARVRYNQDVLLKKLRDFQFHYQTSIITTVTAAHRPRRPVRDVDCSPSLVTSSPESSSTRSHRLIDIPPGSPTPDFVAEFRQREVTVVRTIETDLKDCSCYYFISLLAMFIFGLFCSCVITYVLYNGLCPAKETTALLLSLLYRGPR